MSWRKASTILIIAFLVVAGWWLMSGLQSTGDFGIFLADNKQLVISEKEITFYDEDSYEIKLTKEGIKRIEALGQTVPVNGTRFVLRIHREDIYEGWFWSPISSLPCSGVVIETIVRNNSIRIDAGYPDYSNFQGDDPRGNPKISSYFMSVGKLAEHALIKQNLCIARPLITMSCCTKMRT